MSESLTNPKRSRHFSFTHNNYNNTILEDSVKCRYICYGFEIAPTTGTPHLQGFISFTDAKSLSTVVNLMPGCHVECARHPQDLLAYCQKEANFVERGEKPVFSLEDRQKAGFLAGGEATKRLWENMWDLAKANRIEEIDAEHRIKHYRTLRSIQKDYQPDAPDLDVEADYTGILWICGPPGCGKSRWVRDHFPRCEIFDKSINKWWDGYAGQPYVLLDDFGKPHHVLGEHLKRWGDRYSFPAEIKCGKLNIRPQRFVVTSNYLPEEIWEEPQLLAALKRRIEMMIMD